MSKSNGNSSNAPGPGRPPTPDQVAQQVFNHNLQQLFQAEGVIVRTRSGQQHIGKLQMIWQQWVVLQTDAGPQLIHQGSLESIVPSNIVRATGIGMNVPRQAN